MAALPTGGTASRSMAVGDTLYVADGANGLLVYDISQPWNNFAGVQIPPTSQQTQLPP